jgi:hypothetical protein
LLPLLASAGLGSLISDIVERKVEVVKAQAKKSDAKKLETPKPPINQNNGALEGNDSAALKSED